MKIRIAVSIDAGGLLSNNIFDTKDEAHIYQTSLNINSGNFDDQNLMDSLDNSLIRAPRDRYGNRWRHLNSL
jgi:hypothetical protein